MFAEKPLFPTSNLHLPPISKNLRRRIRPPPTPSFSSRAAKAAHIAENVSALKAKYADYATWLKNSNRSQREPIVSQELLKTSLCQMGIDTGKAERLVSTCSWYVYQFQRDLKIDPEQKVSFHTFEKKKPTQNRSRPKKTTTIFKDHTDDSSTIISSTFEQDDSFLSTSRNHQFVLPPIHVSDLSTSSRSRRVDFDNEQTRNPFRKSSTRLKPLATESSNPLPTTDLHPPSSSPRSLRRHGLVAIAQTRSILRKQPSTSSDTSDRKLPTPSSTVIDSVPLGTRSQRLFGGSECFAQIMNELERQKTKL